MFNFWLGEQGWGRPWFITFVVFHGVNAHTMVSFKLRMCIRWIGCWEERHNGFSLAGRNWFQHTSVLFISLCYWFCLQPQMHACVNLSYGHWVLPGSFWPPCKPVDAQSEKWSGHCHLKCRFSPNLSLGLFEKSYYTYRWCWQNKYWLLFSIQPWDTQGGFCYIEIEIVISIFTIWRDCLQ